MISVFRISVLSLADMLARFAMYVMMNYLTDVWNLNTIHAAGIINIWDGITQVLPIVFTVFVDSFMGDYYMMVVSSVAYSIGLGFLSMSTPPVLGPCSDYKEECIGHTQKVLFYSALSLIAVGMAGQVLSYRPFLYQQKDGKKEEEGNGENFINGRQLAGVLIVWIVRVGGGFGLPYIKPWSIRFSITSICTLIATLVFLSGCRVYNRSKPDGSCPLIVFMLVFILAALNICEPLPDPEDLYNDNLFVDHTNSLRFLDKAAIKKPEQIVGVPEVEETKTHIRIIPMWLTFIVIGIVLSIGNTYFLDQANQMDPKLGRIKKVPIQIFLFFYTCSSMLSEHLYNLLTNCFGWTKKMYAPPLGIAICMVFSILCCITAAKVETRRLDVIRNLENPEERIPMTMFWLLPQILLLGAVDGIANSSITSFFQQQAPALMENHSTHMTKAVIGLGTMASVLSVHIVGKVSERNEKPNWFQPALNQSRFDKYYWTLAALCAANLFIFVIIAFFYSYKTPLPDDEEIFTLDFEAEIADMERSVGNCR